MKNPLQSMLKILITLRLLILSLFQLSNQQLLVEKLATLKPAWTIPPPSPPPLATTEQNYQQEQTQCTERKLKLYNITRNIMVKFCKVSSPSDLLGFNSEEIETCCQVEKFVLTSVCYDKCKENLDEFDSTVILVDLWRTVCNYPKQFCTEVKYMLSDDLDINFGDTHVNTKNNIYVNQSKIQDQQLVEEQNISGETESVNTHYGTLDDQQLALYISDNKYRYDATTMDDIQTNNIFQNQQSFIKSHDNVIQPNYLLSPPPPSSQTFVNQFLLSYILDQVPGLSIIRYYVQTTNIYQLLENPGFVFTLFLPTNEAFMNLSQQLGVTVQDLDKIPGWHNVIMYHIAFGRQQQQQYATNVLNGTFESIVTLQGNSVMLRAPNFAIGCCVTGNLAEILVPDVQAVNGIFHVISSVLLPFKITQ